MFRKIHQRLQDFVDDLVESPIIMNQKIENLEKHLINYQEEYKALLFHCFKDVILEEDQYFYITYTYKDLPIDMQNKEELVVSLLYDIENGFYYEISIFNYPEDGNEFIKTIDLHINH